MIIFGNAWSMNREMDDQTYPSVPTDERYRFADDNETQDVKNLYAGKSTSKFYQSKQAFLEALNDDDLSSSVNLGLATFRQVFGLRSNTQDYILNRTWAAAYPSGGRTAANEGYTRKNPADPAQPHPHRPDGNKIYEASTPEKMVFARDPANFSYIRWGRQYFAWGRSGGSRSPACAYTNYNGAPRFGNPAHGGNGDGQYFESGRGFVDDAFTTYLDNNEGDGGLPLRLRYTSGAIDQQYTGTECDAGTAQWPWGVQNVTGARSAEEANNDEDVIEHALCRVGYNSQSNTFWALYVADRPYVNNYTSHSVSRPVPGSALWDGSGRLKYRDGTDVTVTENDYTCTIGATPRRIYNGVTFISNEYEPAGPLAGHAGNVPAYHSYNPSYSSEQSSVAAGAQLGALTGWSGETIYNHNDNGAETMTARYPSGPADPCRSDRNLCPDTTAADDPDALFRYVQTMGADLPDNPRHMGVFLDLPDPEAGYVDQREKLRGFMAYEQMSASGLDYDPDSQSISGGKGLATVSTSSDHQSPIYQSLFSALAYFTAYKAADPYDDCGRSNHILLFYDGKEDGRWTTVDGYTVYVDPSEMAKRLYDDLDVKVHVVIISNNYGDIAQANAIAEAGGTEEALVVGDLASLREALSSVFANVRDTASHAAPAIPPISNSGDYVYEVTDNTDPVFGQLTAYALNDSGGIDASSPVWRADDGVNQTVAMREARLLSTNADGEIVNFFNDLADSAFDAGNSPDADTIRAYTVDPNYGDGAWLAGRGSSALIGRIGVSSPVLVGIPADSSRYGDPDYRDFIDANSNRKPLVLFTSNDGFLYAVDAATGELEWGWMPRQFLKGLKNYHQFLADKHFEGDLAVIDAKDSNGDYHSYITPTGARGRLRFALRLDLDDDDNLVLSDDSLIWDQQTAWQSTPDNAPTRLWRGADGSVFSVYLWRKQVDGSTYQELVVRDLTSDAKQELVFEPTVVDGVSTTPATKTSMPLVVKEKDDKTYIYLGDAEGNLTRILWSGYQSGNAGTLLTDDYFQPGRELGASEPITYVGYATYKGGEYLRVQSTKRLTVLKRASSTDKWSKSWGTHAGGADIHSEIPTATTRIQHLADNAEITGEALIVGGGILLPVYEASSGDASCAVGASYFYLFELEGGLFPDNKFLVDGAVLSDSDARDADQTGANNPKILLGTGKAHRPRFSVFGGAMSIFGHTEGGTLTRVELNQSPIGRRNWREIYQ